MQLSDDFGSQFVEASKRRGMEGGDRFRTENKIELKKVRQSFTEQSLPHVPHLELREGHRAETVLKYTSISFYLFGVSG